MRERKMKRGFTLIELM
ncbi:MAG: prepilin-type N-terminal cleavage/methylation domain-containing protein, partial [Plesiomonas shigelloides]